MSCNEVIRLLYTVKILIEETEKKNSFYYSIHKYIFNGEHKLKKTFCYRILIAWYGRTSVNFGITK